MMDNRVLLGVGLGTALLCFSALPAGATQLFGTANIGGTVNGFNATSGPWTAEIFSPGNECFRLGVAAEGDDLEMTVVAPNGTVYRNDDRNGASDRRPLVLIDPAPNNGWYTVSIDRFDGAGIQANFTLAYSHAASGSANCQPPTTPLAPAVKAGAGSRGNTGPKPPTAGAPGG